MKKQSYLKETFSEEKFESICLRVLNSGILEKLAAKRKLIFACCVGVLALPVLMYLSSLLPKDIAGDIDEELVQMDEIVSAETSTKKSVITIPGGTINKNPFLPYRSLGDEVVKVSDVPDYSLELPPEEIVENSDASRIMRTTVSGILYDKYSPSAILNIEGKDHLVKKGDTVNDYKVIAIAQDSVTVKLGTNVYKAGIGEYLKGESLDENEVSNLNNKFGGGK